MYTLNTKIIFKTLITNESKWKLLSNKKYKKAGLK